MAFRGRLKQSTAVTIKLGPFVDETDGKTAETALTIAQADVRLSKNGGNMAQKAETTSCTHDEVGMYDCPIDTTDTNTIGLLTVNVHEAGALPVRQEYEVISSAQYEEQFGARLLGLIAKGTMQAGSTASTAVLAASTSFGDDLPRGSVLLIVSGTGAGQSRLVIDWVSTTDTATVSPDWDTTPDNTSVYEWLYGAPSPTASAALPAVNVENIATAQLDAISAEVMSVLGGYQQNVAVTDFKFYMELTAGGAATGKTVTAQGDVGAGFTTLAGAVTEIGSGWYKVNLTQAEMNADEVALRFTAADTKTLNIKIRTLA